MKSDFAINFNNAQLIKQAFIHRSYLNEQKAKNLSSNERLEFLGDAVLELIVSEYLYKKYPHYPEGKLTTLRSQLVQTKTLSLASERLNFNKYLKMSKGERLSHGFHNPSVLADVFEAVIGAIYQGQGYKKAYNFVKQNLLVPAEIFFADKIPQDYKSRLQELIQAKGGTSPIYEIVNSKGPDHNKTFLSAVYIDGVPTSSGQGKSKQEAEQQAAKNALENLQKK